MASGDEDRQKGVEELEQEVTCPVCHDHFQDPKILPCLHYYCKQCIQTLAWRAGANQPFSCPECRSDTLLPQNDPNQLPTAFFINRMKEVHAKLEKVQGNVTAKCEMCPGGAATAFCRQCAEFICDKCTESHHRMKMFADHEVSTLEELKEGGGRSIVTKPPPPPICKDHEEQARLYCFDCKVLICRDCIVIDHKDHRYEFVKKASPMVKEALKKGVSSLRDVQTTIHDAANFVKDTKVRISEQGEAITASVCQSFQMLHEVLNQCEQELLVKVSTAVEKKVKRLALQEESINVSSAMIQSLIDFVEKNIANAAEEELVSQHSQLLYRIKETGHTTQNLKPVAEPDMKISMVSSQDLEQLFKAKAGVSIPTIAVHVEVEDKGKCEVGKVLKIKLQPINVQTNLDIIGCHLRAAHDGSTVPAKVITNDMNCSIYEMKFVPLVRGHHMFQITVDGLLVSSDLSSVFVRMPPSELCDPVKIITLKESPRGIAIKPTSGEILISTCTAVVATDKNGEKLSVVASSDQYDLFGIAIDQDGYIYVSDSNQGRLLKLNSRGEIVKSYRIHNEFFLRGVTVHNDEVYLCSCGNRQVHVLTKELTLKNYINFSTFNAWPSEVAVDADGQTVYICDHDNSQIIVYSKRADEVISRMAIEKLSQPCAVCISGSLMFVSEWGENRVSVLTKEGQLVTTFGHRRYRLQHPSRIAVDSNGFVYVCDTDNQRVLVF